MEGKLPVRNLVRISWLQTIIISTIVFLFLLSGQESKDAVIFFVMSLVVISIISFANVFVLAVLYGKLGSAHPLIKIYRYGLTYAISLLVYLIIWPVVVPLVHMDSNPYDLRNFLIFVISSAMINTFIIIIHNHILLIHNKAHSDLELANIKTAHAEAANLLLKQQIHPHFLFNALNTLKILYRKDAGRGDQYMVHLANFLRASVSEHASKIARLDEEIAMVRDYVEMQKIRFGAAFTFTVSIPENTMQNHFLPSFSLQPLIENAIKHNELTEATPLQVTVSQQKDMIVVINNLQRKEIQEGSAGNGLANLAERYRLWSGDEILIEENNSYFCVRIKLLPNDSSDNRR